MKKAIFSGSFDPITYGHLDIIERASLMFDEVYVVIGTNPVKTPLFSVNDRVQFMTNALGHIPNLVVGQFSGLLAEFAYSKAIRYVVRGFRNSADLEYEKTIASVNASISGVETIYLQASDKYANVSSSMVKSVVKEFGNVEHWVPLQVKSALEKAMLSKMLVGVVGYSGSGKSHLLKRITEIAQTAFQHINMDALVHDIYRSTEPYALLAKEQLMHKFGAGIFNAEDMGINRKALGRIVFENPDALAYLNKTLADPIRHALYKELRKSTGKVLMLEGAVLVENGHCALVNNNVLRVTCEYETRLNRIMKRDGLIHDEASNRLASQKDNTESIVNSSIAKHKYGKLISFDTTEDYSDDDVENLCVEILGMW